MTVPTVCRCGHAADAHEHFRPGYDCGACHCRGFDGVGACDASPTAGLAAVLLAAFGRR
jgi:hypothetical protein